MNRCNLLFEEAKLSMSFVACNEFTFFFAAVGYRKKFLRFRDFQKWRNRLRLLARWGEEREGFWNEKYGLYAEFNWAKIFAGNIGYNNVFALSCAAHGRKRFISIWRRYI
jgi:hypothetical protein